MKPMKVAVAMVATTAILVLVAFAFMGFVFMDGMSYTATGSETLSPAGQEVGKALVVYDPGLSGQAKNVAALIAGDLRNMGYRAVLAGVRSPAASDVAGYDVIVTGGPVYAGNVSSSIASYQRALTPPKDTRFGAFATGQDPDIRNDPVGLKKEVAPLPANSSLRVDAMMKIVGDDEVERMCAAFVDELVK